MAGIIPVLRTGMQWKHLPRAVIGCSGKTSWRRLGAWQAAGVWAALHRVMLERLQDADALDWSRAALASASQKGGTATGPNPADRGKPGTKRHLVVDANGTPPGLRLTGANGHDSRMLAATRDAVPGVRTGHRGRPRRRPDKLHAAKATIIAAVGVSAGPAASHRGLLRRHREQRTVGSLSLDRGTDAAAAGPLPSPHHP